MKENNRRRLMILALVMIILAILLVVSELLKEDYYYEHSGLIVDEGKADGGYQVVFEDGYVLMLEYRPPYKLNGTVRTVVSFRRGLSYGGKIGPPELSTNLTFNFSVEDFGDFNISDVDIYYGTEK